MTSTLVSICRQCLAGNPFRTYMHLVAGGVFAIPGAGGGSLSGNVGVHLQAHWLATPLG